MKRKKKLSQPNLKPVVIFSLFVFSLLALSVLIKFTSLVLKGKFDGQHRFTISINNEKNNLISFAPDSHTIAVLQVLGDPNLSTQQLRRVLEIPIDGFVFTQQLSVSDKEDVEKVLRSMVLNYKDLNTDLTIIDMARLWFYTKTLPVHDITIKQFLLPKDALSSEKESFVDRISSQLFTDNTIVQEKVSIQVINGTNVAGLGNRLARLITNMGGNVVAVTTAEKEVETSQISYFGSETYTLKRLSKILGYKQNKLQKQLISDIIITVGKDSLAKLVY